MPRHGIKINERVSKSGERSWHIRYSNGGQLVRETFPEKQLAEERVAEIEYWRRIDKLPATEKANKISVEDFIADTWWPAKRTEWKPATIDAYRTTIANWITPYIGHLKLGALTVEAVDRYRQQLQRDGCGVPTINKTFAILEGVINFAAERGYGIANPFAAIKPLPHKSRKPEEPLSLEDLYRLKKIMSPKDGLAVSLIGIMGLRQQECFALTWGDLIDRDGKPRETLHVTRSISGGEIVSGGKSEAAERELDLPEAVRQEIAEIYLLFGRPGRGRPVFVTSKGVRMSHHVYNRNRFAPAQRQLGMVKRDEHGEPVLIESGKYAGKPEVLYTPHDMRDVAGDIRIRAGWDIRDIAMTMAHSSITTTEKHYFHRLRRQRGKKTVSVEEQLDAARKKIGPPDWQSKRQELAARDYANAINF